MCKGKDLTVIYCFVLRFFLFLRWWIKKDCKHEEDLKSNKSFSSLKPFKWRLTAIGSREQSLEGPVYFEELLTHFRHLRDRSYKGSIWKFGCIVIDVLYFDDEFWLWFQGLLCVTVQCLRMEDIMCFPLPIQALSGMNIPCHLIDDKYSPSSFAAQNVPDRSITFVWVWVKLEWKTDKVCVNMEKKQCKVKFLLNNCKIPAR